MGLEIETFKTIRGPIRFLKDYHAETPSSPAGLYVNWIPSGAQGKKLGHGSSNQAGLFVPYSREMATHSSVLAWRSPGTEEPGGLLSVGSHRVRHDWCDLAAARVFKQPTSPSWASWVILESLGVAFLCSQTDLLGSFVVSACLLICYSLAQPAASPLAARAG